MEAYYPTTTTGWCAVSFAAVTIFLTLWARREKRRSATFDATSALRSWGADDDADLFKAYTIGNYLGALSVYRVLKRMYNKMMEPGGIVKMYRKLSDNIVDHDLKTEDGRKAMAEKLRIAELVAAATKPEVPETPTLSPTVPAA